MWTRIQGPEAQRKLLVIRRLQTNNTVVSDYNPVWRLFFVTVTNFHVHKLLYTLQRHKNMFKAVTVLTMWRISTDFQKFFQTYIRVFNNTFLPFIPCLKELRIQVTQCDRWGKERKKEDEETFSSGSLWKIYALWKDLKGEF